MATKKKTAAVVEDTPPAPVELPATTVHVERVDLQPAEDGEESMTINDFVSVVKEGKGYTFRFVTFDDGESMLNVGFDELHKVEDFAEKCIQKIKHDLAKLKG